MIQLSTTKFPALYSCAGGCYLSALPFDKHFCNTSSCSNQSTAETRGKTLRRGFGISVAVCNIRTQDSRY